MKVIKGVLEEELANSMAMQKTYERELARLPTGSLVKKRIKGHEYWYLQIRQEGRVRFIYKGKLSAKAVERYQQAKQYRATYRRLLSETKRQIKFLRTALRGKGAV
jgi:hypothetical protein